VRNIHEVYKKFPPTEIIRLERNYRSTAPILRIASSVVKNNTGRLGKNLIAVREGGKTPVLVFLPNQDEETKFAAELIEASVKEKNGNTQKAAYSDWAVLYRTNAQSLGFETELLRRGIPFRVVGSLKFYEREEIKDALALLAFLINPKDEIAFRRIVNKPTRGIGETTVNKIIAEADDFDLLASCKRLAPSLPAKAKAGLNVFIAVMKNGRDALMGKEEKWEKEAENALGNGQNLFDPAHFFEKIEKIEKIEKVEKNKKIIAGEGLSLCVAVLVQDSGIAAYHLAHDEIAGNQRIANLQELANAASLYPADESGLIEFLEHIELDRSMEQGDTGDRDAVTLITLHNTKGLEFRRVIISGVEQGVFPRDDKKDEDLEEERRLFYVGVTRAMDELYFTSCFSRRMFGRAEFMEPSIFLKEIDPADLRIIGNPRRSFFKKERPKQRFEQEVEDKKEKWEVGERVFNDENGYGTITEIRDHKAGPVLIIRFDTGKEARFLSRRQSAKITKVSEG
jgi:DNA helicase-2/ATP-dependent DNA helicase PcrA